MDMVCFGDFGVVRVVGKAVATTAREGATVAWPARPCQGTVPWPVSAFATRRLRCGVVLASRRLLHGCCSR